MGGKPVKLRFLGTGTSFGVPVVGCRCDVCRSDDPRDARDRHGLLLEREGRRLLVDAPPELRLQLLETGVRRVDAVWLTHPHADHLHGIDDLRIFTLRSGRSLRLHASEEHASELRRRFRYIFDRKTEVRPDSAVPDLELATFRDRQTVEAAGMSLTPVGLPHGSFRSFGFRTGGLAVLIDAKEVPEDAAPLLQDLEVLVLNALWFGNPHPAHLNVEEAVETARRLGARRTFLTHLTHRVGHQELTDRLPPGIRPAHDGLEVEL